MNSYFAQNKRGLMFSLGLLIIFIMVISSTFVFFQSKYNVERENVDLKIGSYQSSTIRAAQEGEKFRLYVEQAAKLSTERALLAFGNNGGDYYLQVDTGSSDPVLLYPECGRHVYRKWSNKEEFCAPSLSPDSFSALHSETFYTYLSLYPLDASPLEFEFQQIQGDDGIKIIGISSQKQDIDIYAEDYQLSEPRTDDVEESSEIIWPVSDVMEISSCYGPRIVDDQPATHYGIDISVPHGTPVQAVADGRVYLIRNAETDRRYNQWGKLVIVESEGFFTSYKQLINLNVNLNQWVTKGQVLGLSGHPVLSEKPFLHFAYHETNPLIIEDGKNPLCMYGQDVILQLTATPDAENCIEKYGLASGFTKDNFLLSRDCKRVQNQDLITKEGYGTWDWISGSEGKPQTLLGEYFVSPNFVVNAITDINPEGEGYYGELQTWAKDVWDSCDDAPSECFDRKIEEFNNAEMSFNLLKSYQCEENLLYHSILRKFEDCINNEISECVCKLNLLEIPDNNNYRIEFKTENPEIKIKDTDISHFPNGIPTYTSVVAGVDAETTVDFELVQQRNGDERIITITNEQFYSNADMHEGRYVYPEMIWYKPTTDKMVLVRDSADYPECLEREGNSQDTFLICAQSKNSEDKVKFALQLRDALPEGIDSSDITLTPIESDTEGTVEQVLEVIKVAQLVPGLGLVTSVVIPIAMEVLPDEKEGAVDVKIDIEDAPDDLAGFEVHCGIKALKDLDPKNAQGFVSVKEDSALEVDEKEIAESVGLDHTNPCEYIKVPGLNGALVYMNKIKTFVSGNVANFRLNNCGDQFMRQVSDKMSEYCVTLVRVDDQGNRNVDGASTNCFSLTSSLDRVLEALGLKQLTGGYLDFVTDAKDMVTGIVDGKLEEVWKMVGDAEFLDEYTNFVGDFRNKYVSDIVQSIMRQAPVEAANDALKGAWDKLSNAQRIDVFDDLYQSMDLDFATQLRLWGYSCKQMDIEEVGGILEESINRLGALDQETRNNLGQIYSDKTRNLPISKKTEALQQARAESQTLSNEITRMENANRIFNSRQPDDRDRELNELGLTDEQTQNLFERTMKGQVGVGAQSELLQDVRPDIPESTMREICAETSAWQSFSFDVRDIYAKAWEKIPDDLKLDIANKMSDFALWTADSRLALADSMSAWSTDLYKNFNDAVGNLTETMTELSQLDIFSPMVDCKDTILENYRP